MADGRDGEDVSYFSKKSISTFDMSIYNAIHDLKRRKQKADISSITDYLNKNNEDSDLVEVSYIEDRIQTLIEDNM